MKQFIIYLILFSNAYCIIGQSNLGIKTIFPDSIQIEIDSEKQAYCFLTEAKILNLNSGPHEIRLLFDSLRFIEKSIYLEDGVEHWFELKIDSANSKFKFYNTFPIAQSDTVTAGRLVVNLKESKKHEKSNPTVIKEFQNSSNQATDDQPSKYHYGAANKPIKDTAISTQSASPQSHNISLYPNNIITDSILKKDSLLPLSFGEMYQGKRGCDAPSLEFDNILALISQEPFSKKRMAIVNSKLQNECLSIAQIIDLLRLFDFEDHKLEIIMSLQKNIFDLDNVKELAFQFQLTRHKEKFITFFKLK